MLLPHLLEYTCLLVLLAFLSDIGQATREELEALGAQHSCIFASAVLVEVLRKRGFSGAQALTVHARVLNPPFTAWVKARGYPKNPTELAECEAQGGAIVGLGGKLDESLLADQWPGHAVVITPGAFGDRHALLDVTITQANKQEWGIELPPLLARVGDEFVRGEKEFKADVNSSLVVYKALPDDGSYQASVLWTDTSRWKSAAERAIAALG